MPTYIDDEDEYMRRMQAFLAPSMEDSEDPYAQDQGHQFGQLDFNRNAALDPKAALPPQATKLSPALQKYYDVAQNAPPAGQYRPSKWRRFGAALAGGLAGMRDPKMGVDIAKGIVGEPYHQAMSRWQQSLESARTGAGLYGEQAKEDVAQQRAESYRQSALARETAARGLDKYRQWQTDPKRFEEKKELEKIAHPPPREPTVHETEIEFYNRDPESYKKYQEAKRQRPGLTFDEWKQRQDYVIAHRRPQRPLAVKEPRAPTPQHIAQAEQLAIHQIMRASPEYTQFIDENIDPRSGGKLGSFRIKTPNEFLEDEGSLTHTLGFKDPAQTKAKNQLVRNHYKDFLELLDQTKKQFLQQTQQWTITPMQDEPQEPEDNQEDQQ